MFPPTPVRRRTREESLLFDDAHLSPTSNKRLKAYGTELSIKLGLAGTTLDEFVDVCQLIE